MPRSSLYSAAPLATLWVKSSTRQKAKCCQPGQPFRCPPNMRTTYVRQIKRLSFTSSSPVPPGSTSLIRLTTRERSKKAHTRRALYLQSHCPHVITGLVPVISIHKARSCVPCRDGRESPAVASSLLRVEPTACVAPSRIDRARMKGRKRKKGAHEARPLIHQYRKLT